MEDEPGRSLRNLGEPWEPLRTGTASGTPPDQLQGPAGQAGRSRTDRGLGDGLDLYRSGRGVYVPPPGRRVAGRRPLRRTSPGTGLAGREDARAIPRKSRGVYAGITDFPLQLQRSEKTGTELGTACRLHCRCRMPLARCGEGHTNGRDRSAAWPLPPLSEPYGACPRPPAAQEAAAARERPRSAHATVPLDLYGASASLRSATRAPVRCVTQRWHTPALGALAPCGSRPCQGKRMPPYS